MSWYRWDGEDLVLVCHIQPGASRSGFAGLYGEAIKIRVAAPPVDGRANAALVLFLAEAFGVPRSQISLLAGESGRSKRLRIGRPARVPAELAGLMPDNKKT